MASFQISSGSLIGEASSEVRGEQIDFTRVSTQASPSRPWFSFYQPCRMSDEGYEIVPKCLCCCERHGRKGRKPVAMLWFVSAQLCSRFVFPRKWEGQSRAHHHWDISPAVKREEGFQLEFGSLSLHPEHHWRGCSLVGSLPCQLCESNLYLRFDWGKTLHVPISEHFLLVCSLTLLWIVRSVLLRFDITEMNHLFISKWMITLIVPI